MASDEKELEASGRGRRGRRPSSKPASDGNPGLLRVLWADLRKQEVPSEPDPLELEEFEEEQEMRRQLSVRTGRVTMLPESKREQWRSRYWNN